ncbi:MAG: putative transposase [Candidatus Methanolliviera sp. GoM_oil]|nr:MAG: putative transposase [Candidatus Methanolliviera sp. GoM_oil]
MRLKRALKYRIYPNREQKDCLEEWLNTCRVLYNDCLTERRDAWQCCRKPINYYDQANQLKEIKTFDEDLKEVHSQVIQDVLKRIDKAFKNFFRRVKRKEKTGYPRYKQKFRYNSFTYPQRGFKLEDRKLILSKIGSVNIKQHRDIPEDAEIKTCTVERDLDRWYACFTVEIEIEEPDQYIEITNPIGIDLGISHLITLSNGNTEDNPKYLSKSERKLARRQRRLSKSKKRSNNRGKRRFEVAKTHSKVKEQRTDLLHKISHKLVDTYDLIVFEDLKIRNMLKNHHLAKSISDATKSLISCRKNGTFLHVSWSQLTNFVSYKAEETGRRVEFVNPKNTSQECSRCGRIVKKPLSQRVHKCPFCGLIMDRDQNAAINILKRGLRKSKGFSICQKSSIFEQLRNVGQGLPEFKPEDFSKRRMIQEASPFRAG